MLWEHITPLDWILVAIPPIVLVYFGYGVWKDIRARKKREKEEEEELEAAIMDWMENPRAHKTMGISSIMDKMSEPRVTKVLDAIEDADGFEL